MWWRVELEQGVTIVSDGGGSGSDSPSVWEGRASTDVSEVWLVNDSGQRLPASLVDLARSVSTPRSGSRSGLRTAPGTVCLRH